MLCCRAAAGSCECVDCFVRECQPQAADTDHQPHDFWYPFVRSYWQDSVENVKVAILGRRLYRCSGDRCLLQLSNHPLDR